MWEGRQSLTWAGLHGSGRGVGTTAPRDSPSPSTWWRSRWALSSPAFTCHVLTLTSWRCLLLSLKVHSSLLSHFLRLLSLMHNWWMKSTIYRSEAPFLNFQLEAAFSHHWILFTFHSLRQQPGAEVWLCFQQAPSPPARAPPTNCPSVAERCPCSAEQRWWHTAAQGRSPLAWLLSTSLRDVAFLSCITTALQWENNYENNDFNNKKRLSFTYCIT